MLPIIQINTTHHILNYNYYFLAYICHKLYQYLLLHSHKGYYAPIGICEVLTQLAHMCLSGDTMSRFTHRAIEDIKDNLGESNKKFTKYEV